MLTKVSSWLFAFFFIFFVACQPAGNSGGQLPPPTFTVFTQLGPAQTGLTLPAGSAGTGLAVADFNLDGLPDLYFASTKGSNHLFLNRGNLQFEDVTASAGVELSFGVKTGVALTDVNSDGWPDIFQCRSGANPADRGNQLFVNQRNGTFLQQAGAYRLNVSFASAGAVFFDNDLDGDLDLLLVNRPSDFTVGAEPTSGTDRFFKNDGDYFTLEGGHAGISNRAPVTSVSVLDLNRDRYPDLLATTSVPGPGHRWNNLGDGTFADSWGSLPDGNTMTAAADLDCDGWPDLLFVGFDGKNSIWRSQDLTTQPVGIPAFAGINMVHDRSLQPLVGDLDNDGRPDIFLAQYDYDYRTTMGNLIYRNLDTLQLVELAAEWGVPVNFTNQAAALADLDADGDLDLVLRSGLGEAVVFRNQTREQGRGHFLRVQLLGPRGNTPGISALVRILAGGHGQSQVLNPQVGMGCSVLLPLHFGLGEAGQVERLEVVWPDGRQQVLENVPADQLLKLKHEDAQAGQ